MIVLFDAPSICRRSVYLRGLAACGPPGTRSMIPDARVTVRVRQAGSASSASTADVAAVQATRLAGEGIRPLSAGAMDATALPFEFFQCDGR